MRVVAHYRAVDAHRQRQAGLQRGGARRIGRRTDLRGQAVDVVAQQRLRPGLETADQRPLQPEQEDRGTRQRQRAQRGECEQQH